MLAADPASVSANWAELPRTKISRRRWPNVLLGAIGRLLRAIGLKDMADDVQYLGLMLSWVTMKTPPNYIGEPRAASQEAGDRMLEAFSDEAVQAVEAALDGGPPCHTPVGCSLRFLEPSR